MSAIDTTSTIDSEQVRSLLDTDQLAERLWQPEDLAAVLRHQLGAPVQYDLRQIAGRRAGALKALADADNLLLKSFDDLFHHPHPPLDLLRMAKDFAKAHRVHQAGPVPPQVAAVLYFVSIAVAQVRCRVRLSSLSNADLAKGYEWCRQQPWVDPSVKALLEEALHHDR